MRRKVSMAILSVCLAVAFTGCSMPETLSRQKGDAPVKFNDVSELTSGRAYVWHNEGATSIQQDLERIPQKDVFFACSKGDINFKGDELAEVSEYPRSIWVDSTRDSEIPTLTGGDRLLYVSEEEVPDSFVFERFADYGYTIGVSNLYADAGEHYYLSYAEVEEDDYKKSIDTKSDAGQLCELNGVARLYFDQVGEDKVTKKNVSDGGTVLGLVKDQAYVCTFYTGTFYQDFKLTSNIHSFGSMERFVSSDYEFLHSNCIAITIPEYLKTGYYFIHGVGLFRYVAEADQKVYNGEAYDPSINWNDPIILYNEDGTVKYDPSYPEEMEETILDQSDAGEEDFTLEQGEATTETPTSSGEEGVNGTAE